MRFSDPVVQDAINSMTNWQRNQWARAGHPTEPDQLAYFMTLQRPTDR